VPGLPTLNARGMSVRLTIGLVNFDRAKSFVSAVVACNDRNVSGLACHP
jgi:hypothetical protein